MRIGVMLRHYEQKEGGVKVYTKHLLPLLFSMGSRHDYVLMYANPKLIGTYRQYSNVYETASTFPGAILWDQIAVPWMAHRNRVDLIFNPKFTVPLLAKAKKIFVLHGSEWFVIPEHFLWYDRLYFRNFVPLYCHSADAFIAVSNAVKDDVVRFVGVSPDKVVAIHNGFEPTRFTRVIDPQRLDEVRRKYQLPERFIVWVGQIESRKNVGRLLQAFARIRGEFPHELVIAGAQRFTFPMAAGAAEELKLIERLNLQDRVRATGWISHEDLPAVYSLADLFAFPSLYEGFGIPLLEAMACGCPIVTANTCAPPEVVDSAAYLVDPLSVDDIENGLRSVLSDSQERSRLISAGLIRARDFSWEKCARQVLDLFESVMQ
jgi:glycosyltransferase involved in cell wall biosynthesis